MACSDPDSSPPAPGDPNHSSGRVVHVVDGDTFYLDTRDVSIRVRGLDAPERGEPGGTEATLLLRQLIENNSLTCRQKDIDRYQRIVGQCFTGGGDDIAAVMIEEGVASEYCRYSGGAYGSC